MSALCRDCAFFGKHEINVSECRHPKNELRVADMVNGGEIVKWRWYQAQFCREDDKSCGPDAKWFFVKQAVAA